MLRVPAECFGTANFFLLGASGGAEGTRGAPCKAALPPDR